MNNEQDELEKIHRGLDYETRSYVNLKNRAEKEGLDVVFPAANELGDPLIVCEVTGTRHHNMTMGEPPFRNGYFVIHRSVVSIEDRTET